MASHLLALSTSIAALTILATGAQAQVQGGQPPAGSPAAEGADTPQGQIIVTGTRRQDRTLADSPVPIDVIGGDALVQSGFTETNRILRDLVPSFNFPQPSITDGTDALRPATLRGLSPDQTLVLVNGKRRHTSALLNINGSVGRGSAAVDLNTIPPLAIERIEVLRDGASSQYGSDAIAGVINVQLRRAEGGRAQVTYGQYRTTLRGVPEIDGLRLVGGQPVVDTTSGSTTGVNTVYQLNEIGERERRDGGTLTVAANIGLPVGAAGYLNLTGQFQDRDATNRAGPDPRRQFPLVGTALDPREFTFDRFSHRYGDAAVTDYNLFLNAGYTLSPEAELYLFGSYGIRDAESAGFYRRANDARNRDFSASTTAFVPFYPEGFLPRIVSEIEDSSIAGGVRGELGGWNYDLSAVYGTNAFNFNVENSFNTSFGQASQRRFDAGTLSFGQTTINLDVQREFDLGIGNGLSVALGAEYRDENFKIVAGDPQSWQAGPFAAFGAPAGAQVFPGFRPANEVDASRNSKAVYAELETEFFDALTVQLAGRFEDYSDFGSTTNGKVAARFEPVGGLAVRGSFSSGFRAPSLHQQFYATSSTNNVNGVLLEIGTFAVTDPVAVALGAQPLRPESSRNLSAGVTFSMLSGLNITADYYRIDIDDRIVITENLQGADVVRILQGAGFNAITSARFFINGIDTRTEGFEIVGTYRVPDLGFGRIALTAGFTRNETEIRDRAVLPTLPGLTLFGRQESLRIEQGQPRTKLNLGADWDYSVFGLTARANRFGEVLVPGIDAARDQVLANQWVVDLELRARPVPALEIALGANNLLDSYPDPVRRGIVDGQNYGLNGYFLPYSAFSPNGFNGRFLYGRISVEF
ncbi:TonB-dependent receptor [Erythrobacteraceae bacterium CFH 75059]|uniref:TonB-dependent receptor plug domain-containing protein n=1 Tax=Qipengyuania thermophila TaxID=2509361 RepID=UPI0010208FB9|nr:TonB-dependent receptor [Qipengyuania thermophila]TCD04790.1 TonB-dependent receptor [Erythrobacteraceae bacterium CFH 75059]